jgi:signal transduction histidine kinase
LTGLKAASGFWIAQWLTMRQRGDGDRGCGRSETVTSRLPGYPLHRRSPAPHAMPSKQCNIRDITGRKQAEAAHRRLDRLMSSNLKLKEEIIRRRQTEMELKKSKQKQERLLEQSHLQQQQLRVLSHKILHTQEEERKRISRELHDVIAQTLVGVNVHLAGLAHVADKNPKAFQRKITRTCRLMEKSVDIVHRFARELRPTMLDDLGLIPALQTFMKDFMEDSGIRVSLKVSAGIAKASAKACTVLYRIVQEALNNVARHAKASRVEVGIHCSGSIIRMDIMDNGQGFDVAATNRVKNNNRLGLLGMRERAEMIGGMFRVKSAPGQHTTVHVELPLRNGGANNPR